MTQRSVRSLLLSSVQVVFAGVALLWLLSQIEPQAVLGRLLGLDQVTIAILLGISLLAVVFRFDTWYAILRVRSPLSLRSAGRITLAVNFINQLLPSRLSGRVAAPFVIKTETGLSYPDAAAAAGVHTGMYAVLYGVASMVGLALIVVLETISTGLLGLLLLSSGLYLFAGASILLGGSNLPALDPVVEWAARWARYVPRVGTTLAARIRGVTEFTAASTTVFRELAWSHRRWARYAASWSVVLLVAPAVRVGILLGAFGSQFEPLILLPLYLITAYSVTLLPLTPGGIGITEATATAVFVAFGVDSGVIVPIVFIDRIFGIYLPAVLGWWPAASLDLTRLSPE